MELGKGALNLRSFRMSFASSLQKRFEAASAKGVTLTPAKQGEDVFIPRKAEGHMCMLHAHTHTQMVLRVREWTRWILPDYLSSRAKKKRESLGVNPWWRARRKWAGPLGVKFPLSPPQTALIQGSPDSFLREAALQSPMPVRLGCRCGSHPASWIALGGLTMFTPLISL